MPTYAVLQNSCRLPRVSKVIIVPVRSDAQALHDTTEPTRPRWQATIRDDKLHHPAAPKASDGPLPRAATRSSAHAEHDADGAASSDVSVSPKAELKHAPIVRYSARPRQHDETASAESSGLRTDLEHSNGSKPPPPPHAASPLDQIGNRQPKLHERSADLHMHAHTGAAPTHAAAVGSHGAAAHLKHRLEPAAHLKAAADDSLAAHAGLAAFAQRGAAAHRPIAQDKAVFGTAGGAGGARVQDADGGGADELDSGRMSSGRPKQVRCEY